LSHEHSLDAISLTAVCSTAETAGRVSVAPEVAIVLPTYNERENVALVIARLTEALSSVAWQAIFVDDDSPDGTADEVAAHARLDPRIRLIHRIGQRGLASACIDGMLATDAPFVAIMDADLQHDATILPRMLARLQEESLDVIVGSRNSEGGSMGEFGQRRVLLSRLGQKIGCVVCRCDISDPMSGFFMLRRSFLLDVVPRLQRGGFKILVDILASSRRKVRVGEIGYTFGARRNGESKLDVFVGIEYLSLIFNKLLGGFLPTRMGLFLLVGAIGVLTHIVSLVSFREIFHTRFVTAQVIATFLAMIGNFYFNNIITFRDRRLRGIGVLTGLIRFVVACSFAACANVLIARWLWQSGIPWYLAGLAGIVLGSAWNLYVSTQLTWGQTAAAQNQLLPNEESSSPFATDLPTDLGVSR
jgi:dolichol-phosphate mannosyltransferase